MIYYLCSFLILCTTSTLWSLQTNGARGLRGHALILIPACDYNESILQEKLTNIFFHIFWDPPSSLFQGIILIQTPESIQWTKKYLFRYPSALQWPFLDTYGPLYARLSARQSEIPPSWKLRRSLPYGFFFLLHLTCFPTFGSLSCFCRDSQRLSEVRHRRSETAHNCLVTHLAKENPWCRMFASKPRMTTRSSSEESGVPVFAGWSAPSSLPPSGLAPWQAFLTSCYLLTSRRFSSFPLNRGWAAVKTH